MLRSDQNNCPRPSAAAKRHSAIVVRRRGFTFIELCFALLITSMVLGAIASISLAMGQAWKRSEELESLTLRARQAGVRIADVVRNGKLLCFSRAGSLDGASQGAAVLIWKEDTNGDGKIQGSELEMIEHDTAAHQLVIYRAGEGNAVQVLTWAIVSDPGIVEDFKRGRTGVPLVRGVYGALRRGIDDQRDTTAGARVRAAFPPRAAGGCQHVRADR